jgi:hypothetical protein
MKQIKFILLAMFAIVFVSNCKKNSVDVLVEQEKKETKIPENFFAEAKVPGVVDNKDNENATTINAAAPLAGGLDLNNGEDQVILGNQLTNPYTLTNMQNAATIIYGGTAPILVPTHKYVRFKPANGDQFDELEDNQDLELQDYPMDYDVVQDGDYYQDPNLGTEDIGWLYAAVPINYTPPAGIQYEVLTTLHLTENALLEDMAESLASGLIYTYFKNSNGTITITRNDNGSTITMRPPNPCEVLPSDDPNYCGGWGGGGGGGGGGGVPPVVDGGIFVQEQTICGQPFRDVPLRQARVVAKRWFKVWRGYTDDNGDFTVTKRFKNKVKVIVKTKNNEAKVCKVRGIRLWQMLFPAKRRIGVFNNNELPNIRYVFNKPTDGNANNKELTYWAAATTHNSIVEFRQYTSEFGLTQPPSKLKVMVTNWGGGFRNTGAAPMWNKCHNNVVQTLWAATFIAGGSIGGAIIGGTIAVANTLKNRMDVIIGYTSDDYNCLLTTPQLKSIVYHELGHAQHYSQAGCSFWESYRNAITVELSKLNQAAVHPYGTGNDASTAPILATGEMWGNHCEKWYSERHYSGATPSNVLSLIQGRFFVNAGSPTTIYNGTITNSIAGLNANYAALESYNPTGGGVWPWIPEGLCYDLFDNRNDNNVNAVIDNTNGFTINQCFNALQTDVQSIPAFRDRLLQQNGNLQQAQVTQLFQRYGY